MTSGVHDGQMPAVERQPRQEVTAGRATGEGVSPAVSLVIGVDLSLTATGMSDGRSTRLIRSSGHKGDDLASRAQRLARIAGDVVEEARSAHLVVIEQPAFSRQTGHMHDRSGLWWLVVSQLLGNGTPLAEVSPTALKKYATGKGNAAKSAMTDATARRYPDVDTGGGDDNRCDALWLAAMGLEHLTGQGVVPAAHRAALDSVVWPTRLEASA